jgi:hypothetical protein
MSDYEARIHTKFGEIVIHFNGKEDLEEKLSQVLELTGIIQKRVDAILPKEPEKVFPGFEDIYTIGPDGLIKLLKIPKNKTDTLKLVLFLSPVPLTYTQLKQITGIQNPSAYMKKDFISNPDGTYALTPEGRADVVNRIIPSIRSQKQ